MKKQENNKVLIEETKKKLDWYISEASDEEYDEEMVVALQKLLDVLEPVKEGMPDVNESWARFQQLAEERYESDEPVFEKKSKLITFTSRYKTIVAAVLLLLVLAVGMGMQTEAVRDNGFFHWLKNDNTGMQMVTSPGGLDEIIEVAEKKVLYNREELPDWAKEWTDMEMKVMEGEGYEWDRVETEETKGRNIVRGYYLSGDRSIVLAAILYAEEITVNTEVYNDYNFVGFFDADNERMRIYKKEEASGEINYMVDYYENNWRYYVMGDDLQEVQRLAVKYQKRINY